MFSLGLSHWCNLSQDNTYYYGFKLSFFCFDEWIRIVNFPFASYDSKSYHIMSRHVRMMLPRYLNAPKIKCNTDKMISTVNMVLLSIPSSHTASAGIPKTYQKVNDSYRPKSKTLHVPHTLLPSSSFLPSKLRGQVILATWCKHTSVNGLTRDAFDIWK